MIRSPFSLPRWRSWLVVALSVLVLHSAQAQWTNPGGGGGGGGSGGGPGGRGRPHFVTATPFSWTEALNFSGPVGIPLGPGGGWLYLPGQGVQIRLVPQLSPDPVAEVILWPPVSGHPTLAEHFFVQFPVAPPPGSQRALVIGFHPFNVSDASIFLGTDLPALCAQKGYVLISPYGLNQTNFANIQAQDALDAGLALLRQWIAFDTSRIYTVGFSMGGCNAVSWAMRHQDPNGLRVAGIIDHTGTMDLVQEYNNATATVKALMVDPDHFGGTPAQVPFAYERVSPFRLNFNAVDPNQARVANLLHIPFFVNVNLDDPNTSLVTQTLALKNYLLAKGASVQFNSVHAGPVHAWSTLPMASALDWIDDHTLPPHPTHLEEYADGAKAYLYSRVLALTPQKVARFTIDSAPSNLSVQQTQFLDTLSLDLGTLGTVTSQTLFLDSASLDGTADTIVLKGYPQAPSSVTLFGFLPPQAWSYSAATQELSITPNSNGLFAQVVIQP